MTDACYSHNWTQLHTLSGNWKIIHAFPTLPCRIPSSSRTVLGLKIGWTAWNVFLRSSKRLITSPDQQFVALSQESTGPILIYEIESKLLCTALEGTDRIVFRPGMRSTYTLLSSLTTNEALHATNHESQELIWWELDQHGRLLHDDRTVESTTLAAKAVKSVLPDLVSEYQWTEEFVQNSGLTNKIANLLLHTAAKHRRRHFKTFENAEIIGYEEAFSNDGQLLLYVSHNAATQGGMREAESYHLSFYTTSMPKKNFVDSLATQTLSCGQLSVRTRNI